MTQQNQIQKPKEVDLFEMLTPKMAQAADMLAYAFLKEQGYNTELCDKKTKSGDVAREKLKKQMSANGVELIYHLPTKENMIYLYYSLRKGEEDIAKSKTMAFECQIIEVPDVKKES